MDGEKEKHLEVKSFALTPRAAPGRSSPVLRHRAARRLAPCRRVRVSSCLAWLRSPLDSLLVLPREGGFQ